MKNFAQILAVALALAVPGTGVAKGTPPDRLAFEVLLDDKPIGSHSFIIRDDGQQRIVETRASFDVNFLFVPVFSYRHSNTEIWQNGCLERISSTTDSNGELYEVGLQRDAEGYKVTTGTGDANHGVECLMSFAYWDKRFLEQDRLINTQTGEVVPVRVQPLGESLLEIAGREIATEGYRVLSETEGVDIKVFYDDATGRWVSLETLLEGGRTMRYVPAMGIVAFTTVVDRSSGGSQ